MLNYKYDLQQKVLDWSGGTIKNPMTNMHKLPYKLVKIMQSKTLI
jgi:hypothetical protein